MANRYWVGGTGNWSDNTNHWSATSGGSPGASKPTSADNVYFDENSFTAEGQTVTIDEAANCLDMDWTGATNSPTLVNSGANVLYIYGSLTFIAAMTDNHLRNKFMQGTGTHTITTNGLSVCGQIVISGTGTYSLQDELSLYGVGWGSLCLNKGVFNTNNQNINCIGMTRNGTQGLTVNLGSSVITNLGVWTFTNLTNLTFDAGTSTIIMTGNSETFAGGGLTYHNVRFSGTPTTVTGANTFNTLTVDSGKTCKLTAGTTQTASALEWDGANIQSSTAGAAATVSVASGTVVMRGGSLKDITAEGGATFIAIGVEDLGGNSGWNWSITKNKIPMSMGMGM
jgi:hypothetical protein